jgi:hypothetical protein
MQLTSLVFSEVSGLPSSTAHEDFDEYMRKRRVFILGAGFSAAAGIPLTSALLRDAMCIFKDECNGIFQRVDGYSRDIEWQCKDEDDIDYSQISFSELCTHLEYVELSEHGGGERWSDAGSREKLALKFYLAKSLSLATPAATEIPEIYIKFAQQLSHRDLVITFNWDCLLELALQHIGTNYTYSFRGDGVTLAKLHGSMNWRLDAPKKYGKPINTLGWEPIGYAGGLIQQDMWHTNALLSKGAWNSLMPLGEVEPFLVLPGYGKAFDVRFNAPLWYQPGFVFSASRDIYIIGLGLAQDDHFIRSFFLNCLPWPDRHVYIINPDPSVEKNYEFVLRGTNTHLFKEKFSEAHIELMKKRLTL